MELNGQLSLLRTLEKVEVSQEYKAKRNCHL